MPKIKEKTLSIEFTQRDLDALENALQERLDTLNAHHAAALSVDGKRFWILRIEDTIRVRARIEEARIGARFPGE